MLKLLDKSSMYRHSPDSVHTITEKYRSIFEWDEGIQINIQMIFEAIYIDTAEILNTSIKSRWRALLIKMLAFSSKWMNWTHYWSYQTSLQGWERDQVCQMPNIHQTSISTDKESTWKWNGFLGNESHKYYFGKSTNRLHRFIHP